MGDKPINARACPRLACAVVITIAPNGALEVLDSVLGDTVSESSLWFHAVINEADVYVHSSLVVRQSTGAGQTDRQRSVPLVVDTISSEDWTRYDAPGMSMAAPPDWSNLTGDEQVISYMVAGMEQSAADAFENQILNAVFVVDPKSGLTVRLQTYYDGWERPLGAVESGVRQYLQSNGYEVIDTAIVDLPESRAVRVHYRTASEDVQTEAPESIEYLWYEDRVEFDLYAYYTRGSLTPDQIVLIEAMAKSVVVTSPADQRRGLSHHVGTAQRGENDGVMTPAQVQLWTYVGEAGELLTIRIVPRRSRPDGPDTYLIVRTPSGEILAENDDWSRQDSNPCIDQLKLPDTGIYEIEVHSYLGFASGDYTLRVGDQAAPAATNQRTQMLFTSTW